MRPLRLLLALTVCVSAAVLLIYSAPFRSSSRQDHSARQREPLGTFFNWHAPSLLFPPSAVISLTDDNSTFFLARPARFGPTLPGKSLSGPLWIGSGFGEDHLGRSWAAAGWGELGCSDIPDWDGSNEPGDVAGEFTSAANSRLKQRHLDSDEMRARKAGSETITDDDGTDDHLHPSSLDRSGSEWQEHGSTPHADIQSLQEGAEIAGKVVLLSRGGCGFLDKVKWAQRRGAVALIVGDDVRGAGLVTMYARGDTSNVTIPSLFTSHTTAHLLASLISTELLQQEAAKEHASHSEAGDYNVESTAGKNQKASPIDRPEFTKSKPASEGQDSTSSRKGSEKIKEESKTQTHGLAWYKSALFGGAKSSDDGSRRPPSSGNIDWLLTEEKTDNGIDTKKHEYSPAITTSARRPGKTPSARPQDDFVIGVHDWRDPDLAAKQKDKLAGASVSSSSLSPPQPVKPTTAAGHHLGGGSITPGSGVYTHDGKSAARKPISRPAKEPRDAVTSAGEQQKDNGAGWLKRLVSSRHSRNSDARKEQITKSPKPVVPIGRVLKSTQSSSEIKIKEHDGLWVTLTPTPASSSPFFDTLLVLVVSPLVTLTIVYALLILRSRIRRRRWRAPKSVVERLPVRTYQTMHSSGASTTTTPTTSPRIGVTTPLLASEARSIRDDTRSDFARNNENSVEGASPATSEEAASLSSSQLEEKRSAGLAEWRRRYGGKQRECVVCLEEYVDGVSQVMSLPCGHEFHAECITPWLTTRRRTCPICKGDVVRSLARSAASTSGFFFAPLSTRYQDDVAQEDDVEAQPSRPSSRESSSPIVANSSHLDQEHGNGRGT